MYKSGILNQFFFLFFLFRVVRKSSYRLNSLILVAVLVGFVGTLLHVIKLDDDMVELLTTTICNVSQVLSNYKQYSALKLM